jgi:hypothetical protein
MQVINECISCSNKAEERLIIGGTENSPNSSLPFLGGGIVIIPELVLI